MELTYRGVTHEYTPVSLETTSDKVAGKYRGNDWRFRNLKKPAVLQPRVSLTYRGVKYHRGQAQPTSQAPAREKATVAATENKARSLMAQQTKKIKRRQQALLSRVANEVGVVYDGMITPIQGKVQPTFRANYARVGATMS